MTGSEKQIKWAEEIVADAKYSIEKAMVNAEDRYAHMVELGAEGDNLDREVKLLAARKVVNRLVNEYLNTTESASEIIENRGKAIRKFAVVKFAKVNGTPKEIMDAARIIGREKADDLIINF